MPVICRPLPATHSLVTTNHFFAHFFYWSFAGRRGPLIRWLLPTHLFAAASHSRVAADYSFTGYYQPFLCTLFYWSFVGRRGPLIHWLLPTICSQTFLLVIRGSPLTTHSPVTTNHFFARFSTGHSRVAADHSFTGYYQPLVRRLFC